MTVPCPVCHRTRIDYRAACCRVCLDVRKHDRRAALLAPIIPWARTRYKEGYGPRVIAQEANLRGLRPPDVALETLVQWIDQWRQRARIPGIRRRRLGTYRPVPGEPSPCRVTTAEIDRRIAMAYQADEECRNQLRSPRRVWCSWCDAAQPGAPCPGCGQYRPGLPRSQ